MAMPKGIALNVRGHISEGSGENIFLVLDGILHTPPLSSSILPGITRNTVIQLAKDLGILLVEDTIPREMLYIAEEVFSQVQQRKLHPFAPLIK